METPDTNFLSIAAYTVRPKKKGKPQSNAQDVFPPEQALKVPVGPASPPKAASSLNVVNRLSALSTVKATVAWPCVAPTIVAERFREDGGQYKSAFSWQIGVVSGKRSALEPLLKKLLVSC